MESVAYPSVMRIVLAIIGVGLLLAVVLDVLPTTMARGSGFLTRRVSAVLGSLLTRRKHANEHKHRLVSGGFLAMLSVIVLWVVLFWTGWTLVYCGSETAVVNTQTKVPATLLERIYFSGYTLSTLGLGDFQPQGAVFLLAAVVHSLSGLFIITFSVSYMIPVLQAAVERAHLALRISGLGRTPQEIILRACPAQGHCHMLEQHLLALAPDIALLAQRHAAYPVLHYFVGHHPQEALAPRLAALDEALTIIRHALPELSVHRAACDPARHAITELLGMLDRHYIHAADPPPPPPRLDALRRHGFTVENDAGFAETARQLEPRRKLLLAMVRAAGWSWDSVQPPTDSDENPTASQADTVESQ